MRCDVAPNPRATRPHSAAAALLMRRLAARLAAPGLGSAARGALARASIAANIAAPLGSAATTLAGSRRHHGSSMGKRTRAEAGGAGLPWAPAAAPGRRGGGSRPLSREGQGKRPAAAPPAHSTRLGAPAQARPPTPQEQQQRRRWATWT
jgi:hypothetical protein